MPETDNELFSDLPPGAYTLGMTSPVKSAAKYDLTIASNGFFSKLSLFPIGLGLLVLVIVAGGLVYWKKSKG